MTIPIDDDSIERTIATLFDRRSPGSQQSAEISLEAWLSLNGIKSHQKKRIEDALRSYRGG